MAEPMRPADEVVLVWNEDCIHIAGLMKRVSNEVLKSASGRNVVGMEGKDKETFLHELDLVAEKIKGLREGYFPATHNDVKYKAILADYTHPEIVEVQMVPKAHEPGPDDF